MKGKKILMLASQHSALDGRVFHLEARALVAAGYKVAIVAPEFGGEPKEKDGIRIITYKKHGNIITRKINTLRSLTRLAKKYKADYIHVHEVDATLIAGAIAKNHILKSGHKTKLIFDSHEVWPYFFAQMVPEKCRNVVKHLVLAYEEFMIKHFVDAIITAHEIEENYYLWINPYKPIRKVLGGPPVGELEKPRKRDGKVKIIGHDGYFTMKRGLAQMLGAFELIADDYPEVKFLAAGDFQYDEDREYFENWARRTGLKDRVECAGWVGREEVLAYLDRMDIGIVANKDDIHSVRCWPANKMMYYLGRGLPVVSSPNPLYKRYIERQKCGKVAKDYSAKALAEALRYLLDNPKETREMGKRSYAGAKEFDWNSASKELLALYEQID